MQEILRRLICKVLDTDPMGKEYSTDPEGTVHKGVAQAISLILIITALARVAYGMSHANKPDKCVVRSISDVITSPFYAIGCNLSKHRFEYKLN